MSVGHRESAYWDFARVRSTFVFVREFWQMRIDFRKTNKRLNLKVEIRTQNKN